ncbi:MAG: hypothetical protein U0324_23140 [Polyangiales bacterium]
MSFPTVFLADWNGVTRVSPPTRTKTVSPKEGVVRYVCGDECALVWPTWDGPVRYDPALDAAPVGRDAVAALLPGGVVVSLDGDGLLVARGNASARWPIDDRAKDLGAVTLVAPRADCANRYAETFLAVGEDDSLARWDHLHRVSLGRIDRAAGRAHFDTSLTIKAGGGARVTVLPGPGGAVLAALDRARGVLALAHVGGGSVSSVCEVPARSLPQRDGPGIVFQRDDATAVWATLDGETKAQWEIPAEARGDGELVKRGGEVWFLPRDGENLVDLVRGKVVPRKLPAKTAAPRRWFAEVLRRTEALGASSNVKITLAGVRYTSGAQPSCMPRWFFDSGDGGVRALVAWGLALYASTWLPLEDPAWPAGAPSGYGGTRGFYGRRSGLDELVSLFASLDEARLPFASAWPMLEAAYRDARDERVFTADAENLCLDALLRAVASPDRLGHTAVADAWRATPLTADGLVPRLGPLQDVVSWGPQSRGLYGIEPLLASMMASQFGRAALPALAHMAEERPSPYAKSNPHDLRAVLQRVRAM